MATATTIPVIVSEEAAARIAKLGIRSEFDEIVEHARQTLPGLRKIEVYVDGLVDEPETPDKVYLDAYRRYLDLDEESQVRARWNRWWIELPVKTRLEFFLMNMPEEADQPSPGHPERTGTDPCEDGVS